MRTTIMSVMLAALAGAGCAMNPAKQVDFNRVYEQLQKQPRTYKSLHITNADTFTISGTAMTITIEQPLEPIQILPNQSNTGETLIKAVESVSKVGIAAYGIVQGTKEMNKSPKVVNTPPAQIVRPEVIQVPVPVVP